VAGQHVRSCVLCRPMAAALTSMSRMRSPPLSIIGTEKGCQTSSQRCAAVMPHDAHSCRHSPLGLPLLT
jgi:hypothetical protein